jgi:hypothetical protein
LLGPRAALARLPTTFPAWARVVPPYAIGTIAMFWVIECVGAVWSESRLSELIERSQR